MAAISVVLPTYGGDDPDALREAIESLVSQTRQPDELLIIRDGPVPAANQTVLDEFDTTYSFFRVIAFEDNQGRAIARATGLEQCRGDFVAMMDSDDISLPTRLEQQENFLRENPAVDLVGAQLLEFDPETGEEVGIRSLPTDHEAISNLAKTRSPVSQSTVMARRKAILDAGNYRDVDRMEDYGLWVRMLVNGAQFANLPDILVKARTGEGMYERRAGWEYAREEVRIQREFVGLGFISSVTAIRNIAFRVPIRFVPNVVRAYAYNVLFRTKALDDTETQMVNKPTNDETDSSSK